ncbi:MAG: S-adenosylmethionine decarboxylase [Candidatus Gracilibacteria bacterium]
MRSQKTSEKPLDVRHVMVDGYKGHCHDLEDLTDLHAAIEYIADSIGRELVNPPHLFPYFSGKNPADKGLSGMGVMQGGHITVHSFSDPSRRCVFADLAFVEGTQADNGFRRTGKRPRLDLLLRGSMQEEFRTKEHEVFTRGKTPPTNAEEIGQSFGPHLTMEGRLNPWRQDLNWTYDFMHGIPPAIGMTPVTTPCITREGGWVDAVLLIAESHLSLHIAPDGRFYFDAFSCLPFDVTKVLEQIRENGLPFNPESVHLAARGKKFPREGQAS